MVRTPQMQLSIKSGKQAGDENICKTQSVYCWGKKMETGWAGYLKLVSVVTVVENMRSGCRWT